MEHPRGANPSAHGEVSGEREPLVEVTEAQEHAVAPAEGRVPGEEVVDDDR